MGKIFFVWRQDICKCILKGCCLAILLALVTISSFAEDLKLTLQDYDCAKCHPFKVKTIHDAGGKHATEVGCLDCHPQHPPKGENTITPCTLCHEKQPHYLIEDCLHCHADPHKPLVSLRDPIKPARKECLSCHDEVGQQISATPNRHGDLFCTRCHDRHGFIPSCLDCHVPHVLEQTGADCMRCHSAHQPQQVVPSGYLPATFCQVCHKKEALDLAATKKLHGAINCIYCHNGLHPSRPLCHDCHERPHDQTVLRKHRRCLECHGDPHMLVSRP